MFNAGIISARTSSGGGSSLTDQVVAMFGSSDIGGVWDLANMAHLFQDSGRTSPVTAVSQPIGSVTDLSGKGNHLSQTTTSARPTLSANAGGKIARFDGVDDQLLIPSGVYGVLASPARCTFVFGGLYTSGGLSVELFGASGSSVGISYAEFNQFTYRASASSFDQASATESSVNMAATAGWIGASSVGAQRKGMAAVIVSRTTPATGVSSATSGFVNSNVSGAMRANRLLIIGRQLTDSEREIALAWAEERTA